MLARGFEDVKMHLQPVRERKLVAAEVRTPPQGVEVPREYTVDEIANAFEAARRAKNEEIVRAAERLAKIGQIMKRKKDERLKNLVALAQAPYLQFLHETRSEQFPE